MHLLHQFDQLVTQFAVPLLLGGLDGLAFLQGFQTNALQPVKFLVGPGDFLEGFKGFRHQLGFKDGNREIDLFLGVGVFAVGLL